MIFSAGVMIRRTSDNNVLICRPLMGKTARSFPKGEVDDGETYAQTAKRETFEETNIDLPLESLKYMGQFKYVKRNKTIVLFSATIDDKDLPDELICSSTFQLKGKGPQLPEVDKFEWVTISDAIELVHEAQSRVVKNYVTEKM
jgi:8-oxo-dGTP pyrophosphatase MutT (NUDIX family)